MTDVHWRRYLTTARLNRRTALCAGSLSAVSLAAAGVVGCSSSNNNKSSATGSSQQAQVTTISRAAGTPSGASVAAASATATARAASATETPVNGGVLTTVNGVDPPTGDFDMHQSQSIGVIYPIQYVYNRLFKLGYDANYSVIPDLAASSEQPSPTELTLKLRSGVTWHDGQPFSADDVVATLDRIRRPPQGMVSPRKESFSAVDTITAVDPATVAFKLNRPSAALFSVLANVFNSIAARHVLEAKADLKSDNIGTGAFKFQQYAKGVEVRLAKFDSYWEKGLPHLDGVTTRIIADPTQKTAAFATRQLLDGGVIASGAGKARVDSLRKDSAGKVSVYRVFSTLPAFVMFNATHKPYGDVRVRKALALAFDMKDAANGIGYGEARIAGPIGADPWALADADIAQLPGYSPNKDKDYADAKAMLSAARASSLKFDLQYWSAGDYADNAAYIAQVFAKIGVTANPVGNDTATIIQKRNTGNFDVLYYIEGLGSNDPDDWLNLAFQTNGGFNSGKFSDPTLDQALRAQSQEPDAGKRKAMTDQIQKDLVTTHLPRVFLPLRPVWHASWDDVRNYHVGPDLYGHTQFGAVYIKPA